MRTDTSVYRVTLKGQVPETTHASRDQARPAGIPLPLSTRGIAIRLFLTCWLVYGLHFATNTVREIYLALSLGDHLTFRVDEYAHMHPDLFEKEGFGWHINNNPGASMVGAIPYALTRPIIDQVVARINASRLEHNLTDPPAYNSAWPMAREFFSEAWRRGYDVKFGLAAFVTQFLAMAPISAAAAVVMFYVLRQVFGSDRAALGLALLYSFGTPIFFRTGHLNQNLLLAHTAFMGFVAMWNPSRSTRWSTRTRYLAGGLAGGAAVLFDYSGVVYLVSLCLYGIDKAWRNGSSRDVWKMSGWYVLGTLLPIGLLWFYQWKSFGNPFLPAQQWMTPTDLSGLGYQGVYWPQPELLLRLAFDYRYGLFVSSPLMLLAVAYPFLRPDRRRLSVLELTFFLGSSAALWVFSSAINYALLQYNSGIRYLVPAVPFLFLPASVVLQRLPRGAAYVIATLAVFQAWSLAMYRGVERGLGVLEPVRQVISGGPTLPALTTLSNLGDAYGDLGPLRASPLLLFAFSGAALYGLWTLRPRRPVAEESV